MLVLTVGNWSATSRTGTTCWIPSMLYWTFSAMPIELQHSSSVRSTNTGRTDPFLLVTSWKCDESAVTKASQPVDEYCCGRLQSTTTASAEDFMSISLPSVVVSLSELMCIHYICIAAMLIQFLRYIYYFEWQIVINVVDVLSVTLVIILL